MPKAATSRPGWTTVAFGDVVRLSRERSSNLNADGLERFVGLEHIEPGDLRIRRWGDIDDGTTFTNVFHPGQVLFGKRRAYQRKVAVADFSGVCSGDIYVLETRGKHLLPEFLPFICQTDAFFEHAVGTSAGSLSPRTNWTNLADFEFALPPIEEQREMLRALTASVSALDALRSAIDASAVATQSILDRLFEPSEIRRYMAGRSTKPAGYWVSLGEYAPLQTGYPFQSASFAPSGDRLLRGSNVGVDRTNWEPDETRFWPTERRIEAADYILREGDIVIAMDRPFVSDGFKVAELGRDDLPALLLQRVGRFEVKGSGHRKLVWAFVHSRAFHYQLLSQQEGTDLPHISKAQIEGTILPKDSILTTGLLEAFDGLSLSRRALFARRDSALAVWRRMVDQVTA